MQRSGKTQSESSTFLCAAVSTSFFFYCLIILKMASLNTDSQVHFERLTVRKSKIWELQMIKQGENPI